MAMSNNAILFFVSGLFGIIQKGDNRIYILLGGLWAGARIWRGCGRKGIKMLPPDWRD
jgi:hypothetical protein